MHLHLQNILCYTFDCNVMLLLFMLLCDITHTKGTSESYLKNVIIKY